MGTSATWDLRRAASIAVKLRGRSLSLGGGSGEFSLFPRLRRGGFFLVRDVEVESFRPDCRGESARDGWLTSRTMAARGVGVWVSLVGGQCGGYV
jgi:hypothetical protein